MCVCAEGFAGLGQGGDWRKLSLMEDVAIFLFLMLLLLLYNNRLFVFVAGSRAEVRAEVQEGGARRRSPAGPGDSPISMSATSKC